MSGSEVRLLSAAFFSFATENMRVHFLKIFVRIILVLGVILSFSDLMGWFQNRDRMDFLHSVLYGSKGIPVTHPAAKDFMKQFPPPEVSRQGEITHITKVRIDTTGGPAMAGSINYMYRDGARTNHVATFEDVRDWASKSSYRWIAWWLAFFGAVGTIGVDLMDSQMYRKGSMRAKNK